MAQSFRKGWYVLYVRSRYEKRINELLLQAKFTSYLPIIKKLRKWSDRKKIVLEPMFPSYVFVYIDHPGGFGKALSIDGACGFIRFGNEFARVRDEEIENIKILLKAEYSDIEVTSESFKTGEIRKIHQGALAGLECQIIEIENKNKVLVRLDSIRMNVKATIPLSAFKRGIQY